MRQADDIPVTIVRKLTCAPVLGLDAKEKGLAVKGDSLTQRELTDHVCRHNGNLVTREALAYTLATCTRMIAELVMKQGCSVTIEDFGQFRPRIRRVDGKARLTILFLPDRRLCQHQNQQVIQLIEEWPDEILFDKVNRSKRRTTIGKL